MIVQQVLGTSILVPLFHRFVPSSIMIKKILQGKAKGLPICDVKQ